VDSQHVQDGPTIAEDAERRAREWLVLLGSGEATDADRERFEQWLALDERHREAYRQAERIWSAVAGLEALRELEPAPNRESSRRSSADAPKVGLWQWLQAKVTDWGALPQWGLALASVLVVVVFVGQSPQGPEARFYQTAVAEKRTLELPDGTEISLSPETRLAITFSEKRRQVVLEAGEAFFDVASNPQRPFYVASGYAEVKVLGTMFNVNASPFGVSVAVEEGRVQVSGLGIPGRRDAEKALTAGQRVSVSETKGLSDIQLIEPASAGAWRQDLRAYTDRPLAEVLSDLDRYHQAELVIVDEQLSQLRVTAVFPTADVEQMLGALESVLPITVASVDADRIEIRAR